MNEGGLMDKGTSESTVKRGRETGPAARKGGTKRTHKAAMGGAEPQTVPSNHGNTADAPRSQRQRRPPAWMLSGGHDLEGDHPLLLHPEAPAPVIGASSGATPPVTQVTNPSDAASGAQPLLGPSVQAGGGAAAASGSSDNGTTPGSGLPHHPHPDLGHQDPSVDHPSPNGGHQSDDVAHQPPIPADVQQQGQVKQEELTVYGQGGPWVPEPAAKRRPGPRSQYTPSAAGTGSPHDHHDLVTRSASVVGTPPQGDTAVSPMVKAPVAAPPHGAAAAGNGEAKPVVHNAADPRAGAADVVDPARGWGAHGVRSALGRAAGAAGGGGGGRRGPRQQVPSPLAAPAAGGVVQELLPATAGCHSQQGPGAWYGHSQGCGAPPLPVTAAQAPLEPRSERQQLAGFARARRSNAPTWSVQPAAAGGATGGAATPQQQQQQQQQVQPAPAAAAAAGSGGGEEGVADAAQPQELQPPQTDPQHTQQQTGSSPGAGAGPMAPPAPTGHPPIRVPRLVSAGDTAGDATGEPLVGSPSFTAAQVLLTMKASRGMEPGQGGVAGVWVGGGQGLDLGQPSGWGQGVAAGNLGPHRGRGPAGASAGWRCGDAAAARGGGRGGWGVGEEATAHQLHPGDGHCQLHTYQQGTIPSTYSPAAAGSGGGARGIPHPRGHQANSSSRGRSWKDGPLPPSPSRTAGAAAGGNNSSSSRSSKVGPWSGPPERHCRSRPVRHVPSPSAPPPAAAAAVLGNYRDGSRQHAQHGWGRPAAAANGRTSAAQQQQGVSAPYGHARRHLQELCHQPSGPLQLSPFATAAGQQGPLPPPLPLPPSAVEGRAGAWGGPGGAGTAGGQGHRQYPPAAAAGAYGGQGGVGAGWGNRLTSRDALPRPVHGAGALPTPAGVQSAPQQVPRVRARRGGGAVAAAPAAGAAAAAGEPVAESGLVPGAAPAAAPAAAVGNSPSKPAPAPTHADPDPADQDPGPAADPDQTAAATAGGQAAPAGTHAAATAAAADGPRGPPAAALTVSS